MISIIITSFKEPRTIGKAIECFLNQDLKDKFELIVSTPDAETIKVVEKYAKKDKRIRIFEDPGMGKGFALNQLLFEITGEIIVLSDGDVFVKENTIQYIIDKFKDPKVGCVTGNPRSINSRKNMLGYWSHLLVEGMHQFRLNRAKKGLFLECSGYLWAFRNGVIKRFPVDIAEDTVVPYLFREKGYKIAYELRAEVYVKFPTTLKDFINQKKRTAKGHEALAKYVNIKRLPRTKSMKNEIVEGTWKALSYPRNLIEMIYTLLLFPMRLYVWGLVFYHTKVKKEDYQDAWERVESTK